MSNEIKVQLEEMLTKGMEKNGTSRREELVHWIDAIGLTDMIEAMGLVLDEKLTSMEDDENSNQKDYSKVEKAMYSLLDLVDEKIV